ncbi:LacI family DNA-binding transcriptional regulator [Albibacterium indicum]|uniref:LacI family DNA-binding transcriptional regulator n=1 Tax=Albibacterium indicum TaxID=2292082 RepID=UPI000E49B05E|nr:substrate-binding domain-containing protein [Pedobacter indicus]
MKKKSIIDIAKELNISPTTVSFILNDKAEEKRISKKLTKTVKDYVEKVGYKPSSIARSLRTGKTNTIGLMVENIANPFFGTVARKIEEAAYTHGYRILYCSTDNNLEKTKDLLHVFKERKVDGYIISPPAGVEKEIESLINSNIPVVIFDREVGVKTDQVIINNEESTYLGTKHLLENFQNIGFVTLDSNQTQMTSRLAGYQRAVQEAGRPEYIKKVAYSQNEEEITTEIAKFVETTKTLDAILFSTNYLVVNGLKALQILDLKIPQDIGVVAFDHHDLFELHSPTITSIDQPIDEIANKAIQLLLKRLGGATKNPPQETVLSTNMKIRTSSKKYQ